jgi:hypothetical protein
MKNQTRKEQIQARVSLLNAKLRCMTLSCPLRFKVRAVEEREKLLDELREIEAAE